MATKILPEWSQDELTYISPPAALAKFGYIFGQPPTKDREVGIQHNMNVQERVPLQDGEVAPEVTPFEGGQSPTDAVKRMAREFGADLVGVTHVDPKYVYKGHDVPHQFAIVIGIYMEFGQFLNCPDGDSSNEILRVYDEVSTTTINLARTIREHGYPARAHTLRKEDLAMIPHAYAAGLGELGKHGSLINPELGSTFRLGVVTTDLPLIEDGPSNFGIDDFCAKCQLCLSHCPGDAISNEKQDVRGVFKWVIDTERCAPYMASHGSCALCLQVCPWNAKALGGINKKKYIGMMHALDPQERRVALDSALQTPWSFVDRDKVVEYERHSSFPETGGLQFARDVGREPRS